MTPYSKYYPVDTNSGLLVDTYHDTECGSEVFLRTRDRIHLISEEIFYLRELAATLITVANEIEELQKESE
jgi:DNA-binding PadR family transcriptional regulator